LTNITQTQLPYDSDVFLAGSCNGILCLLREEGVDLVMVQLWNPSIRKFKEFSSISRPLQKSLEMYGFGYDPISDNYKVVVVFGDLTRGGFSENEVMVHTLGTDSWKSIQEFPFGIVYAQRSGQYVSGTINWLIFMDIKRFIASFDLGNECYQEVLLPDDFGEVDENTLRLSVFRHCLCMISGEDVWVMKEYGNKESWTKLFTIPYIRDPSYSYINVICVFEDEQVLLKYIKNNKRLGHISYNCKNDTSRLEFLRSQRGLRCYTK
jgi:F-box interacting protein